MQPTWMAHGARTVKLLISFSAYTIVFNYELRFEPTQQHALEV